MPESTIFENAYPYTLPEDKSRKISLEDISIPPNNIVARLNDQWVKEIGLDISKFGYTQTLKNLLEAKQGELVFKENLIEKIRILQTIGAVFAYLDIKSRNEAIAFIEHEPVLYKNLRGSRDQTTFHHKKQLAVILLELIPHLKGDPSIKSVLDLLLDILSDNYDVVKRKTYFDEYNSYTYSEEQRSIASTIVTGIERKIISLLECFEDPERIKILRTLWTYPLLSSDKELVKKTVRRIYIDGKEVSLDDVKEIIHSLERDSAPELEFFKEIVISENICTDCVDSEKMLTFYSKELSKEHNASQIKLLSNNIHKVFTEAKTFFDKKKIIQMIIFPKEELDDLIGYDEFERESKSALPLAILLSENDQAMEVFFEILRESILEDKILKDFYSSLHARGTLLDSFRSKVVDHLLATFSKAPLAFKEELAMNIVGLMKNELVQEKKGEGFINILLEKRGECKMCDFILQKTFQKAYDSTLGRYLNYNLLTKGIGTNI